MQLEDVAVLADLPPGQAPIVVLPRRENRPVRSKGGPTLAQHRETRKEANKRAQKARKANR